MNFAVIIVLSVLFNQQINKNNYVYEVHINDPVVSTKDMTIVLPNADRVKLPVLNNIIPVIYIYDYKENTKRLYLEYEDKDCMIYINQDEVVYTTPKKIAVQKENKESISFLETFSSIDKEIKRLERINSNVDYTKDFVDLKFKIEELTAMLRKSLNETDLLKKSIEKNQSKEEIKAMISEVKKELATIQQKLTPKIEKNVDIINPALPIIDKELVPSGK